MRGRREVFALVAGAGRAASRLASSTSDPGASTSVTGRCATGAAIEERAASSRPTRTSVHVPGHATTPGWPGRVSPPELVEPVYLANSRRGQGARHEP